MEEEKNRDIIKPFCDGSDTLASRLMQYARHKGLPVREKVFTVVCPMTHSVILTVYRQPHILVGIHGPVRYYGEVYYPSRKYLRRMLLDEDKAECIYKKLGDAINGTVNDDYIIT